MLRNYVTQENFKKLSNPVIWFFQHVYFRKFQVTVPHEVKQRGG